MSEWQPIETAPKNFAQLICGHNQHKWVRFGRFEPILKRWYYSGTSERSQWAQIEGDEPTHWMPIPKAPV